MKISKKELKSLIKEEVSRLKKIQLLENRKRKIQKELETFNEGSYRLPGGVFDSDPYLSGEYDEPSLSNFDSSEPVIEISETDGVDVDDLPVWEYEVDNVVPGIGKVSAHPILLELGIKFWDESGDFLYTKEDELKSPKEIRDIVYKLLKKHGKTIEEIVRELISNKKIGPFANDDDWKEE